MYQHLSKPVEALVRQAHQIAQDYGQEYVGTEHVLLAIAGHEDGGLGLRILEEHGATPQKIKAQVDKLIKASLEDTWVFGRLPGTPHFRNVVAKAIEEAGDLESPEVRTEHLLLALLREKGSVGYEALKALGLSAGKVREAVRKNS